MSEKQFDIFDDQFRNASEQYEPAYSEAAWEKMQAKLDEGNKRRRPAGWLWWLSDALMVSLMLYIAFTFYGNKKQDNSNGDKLTPVAGQTIKKETSRLTQEEKNTGVTTAGTEQNKKEENSTTSPATGNDSSEKTAFKEAITSSAQPGEKTTAVKTITNTTTNKASQDAIGIDNSYNQNLPTPEQNTVKNAVDDDETTLVEKSKIAGKEPAAEGLSLVEKPLANTTDSTLNKQGVAAKKTTSKKSQPASNGFFLHAGLAPELSFVKGNEKGPFKLAYGGGIGYAFSNRWNVQAGVYLTQKKYIAGPTDYKAKPGTYYYNLTIYHVNAVCSITEIPLSVTYNVMQRKRLDTLRKQVVRA